MVMATQKLALHTDLYTRQTLTAVHDKTSAWMGLASSLVGLFQQAKLPAAVWGVLFITAHLFDATVLHISVSGLFHVVAYNATELQWYSTGLANANVTSK